MQVARSLAEASRLGGAGKPHAVTIGNFDGVHKGHRELIRVTREKAAARGGSSVLLTFDPHPVHVVRGVASPGILTPLPRKLELLEQAGLDGVLVLPFTKDTAAMTAEEFVRAVLVEGLHAGDLVTGFNFALGKGREGNYSTLCELGLRYHFDVAQVPPVIVGKETVSSSLIREHVRCGDMDKAAELLGRMHSVDGEIMHGQARGRKLGYPTANINFEKTLLPPLGAYATWLQVLPDETGGGTEPMMSMTSVGTNPTFGGGSVTLESHVFDFSGDLYGKRVRLYFVHRLRAEIRFQSIEDLVARLGQDATAAKAALERNRRKGLF
ncbi:bifunctional riboflavin kinase/FAD synthetase [Desulfovibrio sp. OttesenSCG-928-O18]|nr:bifunctional riboflavin kinase/FAD synthetase [Desulfovibrio sp. OttesenSCG-928-O18]